MNRFKITLITIAFIATSGLASIAFAHGGWGGGGYGGHMMGYGYGYSMGPAMMGYGYGPGNNRYGWGDYSGNLSREDSSRLQQAQDKFYDETRTLRDQIREKQFALNNILDSANPDKAKVEELQKAISQLQSKYDQKALTYRLKVHKILPENTGRSDSGYGPGYGGCSW